MTTEDDFHTALDATPANWQTRLVLADWLQERDDPRAEGYRALGVQRAFPVHLEMEGDAGRPSGNWFFILGTRANNSDRARARYATCFLSDDWFAELPAVHVNDMRWWRYYATRRDAEEAAVAAFARLTTERRSELLAAPLDPFEQPDAEATE